MTTLSNINFMSRARFDELETTNDDELYAVESSGWDLPSDQFIDLMLGVTGSTYTAPANGWISLNKNAGAAGNGVGFSYTNATWGTTVVQSCGVSAGTGCAQMVPIRKGQSVYVIYNATGTTNSFRFYYAQGEI